MNIYFWLAGLLLLGLSITVSTLDKLAAFMLLLSVFLLMPQSRQWISKKTKLNITKFRLIAIIYI